MENMNSREQLVAASQWLGWMEEDFSEALKSPEDALKLWKYAQAHDDLAELCDEYMEGESGNWEDHHFIEAIGYVPEGFEG